MRDPKVPICHAPSSSSSSSSFLTAKLKIGLSYELGLNTNLLYFTVGRCKRMHSLNVSSLLQLSNMLHIDLLSGFGENVFLLFGFQTNMAAKPRGLRHWKFGLCPRFGGGTRFEVLFWSDKVHFSIQHGCHTTWSVMSSFTHCTKLYDWMILGKFCFDQINGTSEYII